MKKKISEAIILVGITIFLFCKAAGNNSSLPDSETSNVEQEAVFHCLEDTAIFENSETEKLIEKEDIKTEISEAELTEEQRAELEIHYGTYRVTEFYPTIAFLRRYLDNFMQEPEADMFLGQLIELTQERFITFDVGDKIFDNYIMERYIVENPEYFLKSGEEARRYKREEQDQYPGVVQGAIHVSGVWGDREVKDTFYTFADKDKLVFASFTVGSFLLERCEEKAPEPLPEWETEASLELLQGIYGDYQITDFIPTKFYPRKDCTGEEMILPEEEASLMLGKIVTFSKDLFVTYDNYRQPNSSAAKRMEDGCWLSRIEIENPEYQVKNMRAEGIYGIRDGILTGELAQSEYVEIDVYPGYVTNGYVYLPQMYLANDGRIVMYAMGEYFLLEKADNLDKAGAFAIPDLSGWIGKYAYLKESRKIWLDIQSSGDGGYYADIEIGTEGSKSNTKIRADVCGNENQVSFVLKECISGGLGTMESGSDVLFSIQKDADTGGLVTYWLAVNPELDSGDYFVKE